MKRILSLLLALSLLLLAVSSTAYAADADDSAASAAAQRLSAMTTEEKIAQMLMPSFSQWTDAEGNSHSLTEITDDVADCLKDYGFAGVILFAANTDDNAATFRLIQDMQQANSGHPQLLMAVDQEGGNVTRLGHGTQMIGNMALAALGDTNETARAASILASEVKTLGFNVNFAPVVDVNSDPANPVIGIRSFSDDPQIVARQGVAFMQAQNAAGVISSPKHFPGHGDTATDSHTGLPSISLTYEQLKARDLIPFQACIDAGAELIMTAHIQFPNIEKATYTSVSSGEKITLPATLSRTILTDILRGDMGYEGVVITDAMNMDAIAQHFDPLDAARLAIEAGVDIILMPVNTSTSSGIAALGQYVSDLAQMVDQGDISEAKVNAAVLRVLTLKARHGLLDAYAAPANSDLSSVGSAAHHAVEWEQALASITMVKNDNHTLPLDTAQGKTLVLTAYANEVLSMEYAVGLLRDEGKLPRSAEIEVVCYNGMSAEDMLALLPGAAHVVVVSEVYRASALNPNEASGATSVKIDAVIDQAHQQGADVTVMSVYLPYDVARYQAADAMVIAWSAKGMSADPRLATGAPAQYGANMPAALYLMLSPDESPSGHLPINIPALDENYQYSQTILYPRGYGLSYGDLACSRDDSCPLSQYSDADAFAWYHDGLHWAVEKGAISGLGGGRVAPNDSLSRAMIVTILYRLEGSPAPKADCTMFFDVDAKDYYYQALSWAYYEDIINGMEPHAFGPDANITREQLAAILYRYAASKGWDLSVGEDTNILSYDDFTEISEWAFSPLQWAVGSGLVTGRSASTLVPGGSTTRAEGATMLMRMFEAE